MQCRQLFFSFFVSQFLLFFLFCFFSSASSSRCSIPSFTIQIQIKWRKKTFKKDLHNSVFFSSTFVDITVQSTYETVKSFDHLENIYFQQMGSKNLMQQNVMSTHTKKQKREKKVFVDVYATAKSLTPSI